jgi:hypothetical protein
MNATIYCSLNAKRMPYFFEENGTSRDGILLNPRSLEARKILDCQKKGLLLKYSPLDQFGLSAAEP